MTMRVVGKLEFREVNAVGAKTLLEFAKLGGTIVLVALLKGSACCWLKWSPNAKEL